MQHLSVKDTNRATLVGKILQQEQERAVHKLSYNTIREEFVGKDVFGHTTGTHSKEWIHENFKRARHFYDRLMDATLPGAKDADKWLTVPVGNSRDVLGKRSHEEMELQTDADVPRVLYEQGQNAVGVPFSAANALYHLGDTETAEFLVADAADIDTKGGAVDGKGHDVAKTELGKLGEVLRQRSYTALKNNTILKADGVPPEMWDQHQGKPALLNHLLTTPSKHVTTLVLIDSRGHTNHAVSILWIQGRGWVFDSNEKHALPLSQAALDRCVASDACVGVLEARRFTQSSKKKKMKKNKNNVGTQL